MKKPISVHVDEENYEELKSMAGRQGRPVAELVREAMADYVTRERRTGIRFVDISPRSLGRRLRPWSREEIYDEMYAERTARRPATARPTR
jgi:hypothetical protein